VFSGTVRRAALLLLGGAALLVPSFAAAGCGSGSQATSAGLRLQREDLIVTARALAGAQGEAERETAATRAAWPVVANGVPAQLDSRSLAAIENAARQAATLKLPAVFGEARSRGLTGPASSLAGPYRSYVGLSSRGWKMIDYAIEQLRHGRAPGARFARDNVALYIESVYDGHFGLSQLGKKLLAGWEQLGGSAAFGTALTEAEVRRLAAAYSEPHYRLHPHPGVKLGS
jgi:hypothetical protein